MLSFIAYCNGVEYPVRKWMRYSPKFSYIINDVAVVRMPAEFWETL